MLDLASRSVRALRARPYDKKRVYFWYLLFYCPLARAGFSSSNYHLASIRRRTFVGGHVFAILYYGRSLFSLSLPRPVLKLAAHGQLKENPSRSRSFRFPFLSAGAGAGAELS